MDRPFRRAVRCTVTVGPIVLTVLAAAPVPVHAQGTIDAYIALKGMAQGAIKGTSTAAAYKDEIAAMSLTTSQPYGAATPVLHVVTEASVAPQIMRALETNEVLVTPTVSFVKRGASAALQQVYQIRASRGYVTAATISADVNHVPTVAFDLLLSGAVASTNETGAATTAPPPIVAGTVPAVHGIVLAGEFTGQTMGDFTPSPNAPSHKGILLDSVAIAAFTQVSNGMAAGKVAARPLVVTRPANEDATEFDAASTSAQQFSQIVLHVYAPQLNGQLAEVLQLKTLGACLAESGRCGGSSSGVGSAKMGAGTGLPASGSRTARLATEPLIGVRRVASDATAATQFILATLTVENPVTHTMVTHSFATNTTN